jgi:16S rRNA (cytosine967-C5)-methyltransferase
MLFLKPSLKILGRYFQDPGKNLKLILSGELDKIGSDVNRQAVTRVVYGVVRNQRLLDRAIRRFSHLKPGKIQPDILVLLRIGIYLLVYSKSYPDYAVVNEVVNAAGASRGKAKGFVNAVLRNMARDKTALLDFLENIGPLEIAYSISDVLVDNLRLISPQLEADLAYLNREPLFHLRVNTKDFEYAGIKRMLADHGVDFNELEPFQSFEIKETRRVLHRLIREKPFYFQNTGSQAVSLIAGRFAGQRVLDGCAAPGTKSVTLSLLNPRLTIYANDINLKRVKLMKDFLTRYRFTNIFPLVSDAARPGIRPGTAVDFVIVDAPCTSSGTLRKNPDLKLKIDDDMVSRNAEIQYGMMASLIKHVSDNRAFHYLLYSVCSFIREETEGIMEKVFHGLPGVDRFKTVDLSGLLEEYGFNYKRENHGYYLLPSETLNNDIFYIVLLKKHNSSNLTIPVIM